ncbi:hypothetical protein CDAR_371771 [Caerostris darwini]|uniref:Uncharacterized protein n=1 Tax=Caerostris darwini TaxID=1538125 RepID=A0AAV4U100_9ARAC|nr:hypothetical protein CDAR_371771 [Caerostris darwini]
MNKGNNGLTRDIMDNETERRPKQKKHHKIGRNRAQYLILESIWYDICSASAAVRERENYFGALKRIGFSMGSPEPDKSHAD